MLQMPSKNWSAIAGRGRDSCTLRVRGPASIHEARHGDAAASSFGARAASDSLATLAAFVACAGAGSASRPREHRASAPSTPSTVLTEAEIMRAGAGTAYGTIEQLRPWYLSRTRTRGASCERAVYVDRTRQSGLDALRGLSSASLLEIRILEAPEATIRFGTGHCAGAIVVVTQRGR